MLGLVERIFCGGGVDVVLPGRGATALTDVVALLVFVAIGVTTHEASAAAFVRDLLCFELAWLAVARVTRGRFLPTWLVGVTLAVSVRAALVGHFSASFYGVALGFTALLVLAARALSRLAAR